MHSHNPREFLNTPDVDIRAADSYPEIYFVPLTKEKILIE